MDYVKIRFDRDFDGQASNTDCSFGEMYHTMKPQFILADQSWNPAVDVYQTPLKIIIRMEIAGVEQEDLRVEVNSKAVRICGQRRELTREANSAYRLAEIRYGRFERILYLPEPIDADGVSSSYKNGFLEIQLVRLKQESVHKIPIDRG
jgi:HSP20 family protein